MQNLIVIFAALLPIAVLMYYIYRKDSLNPEPKGQLIGAFLWGILSVFLSFCISMPFASIGLYTNEVYTVFDAVRISFFGAAIPEEVMKLLVLWLFLRKNRYFDEKMDGIVYAVCVSMGFAALENVMYLFQNYDDFMSVGIARAIFAVPGHFCFGVLMGYYYSMVKFYPRTPTKNKIMVIAAPVLVHGIYDSILFTTQVSEYIGGLLFTAFVIFCYKLWKYATARMQEHLDRDRFTQSNVDE